MPTLDWIGKNKVINHHLDVPFRMLNRKYSFDANGQHDEDNGSENMIIHGDNLEALKALLPKYEGKIDCIYIDPPYNTGKKEGQWIYSDNVDDPVIREWIGKVVGDEEEDLTRHDKWLCMMYPRLRLLHRLLAEKGSIFISIGDDELASLRYICDEIFGRGNRIAIFTWKSRNKPSNTGVAKIKPQNDAEYILCYGKSKSPLFRLIHSGKERSYPKHDKDGNYRLQTILKSNRGESKRDTMTFELNGYKPPATKRWQAGEEKIKTLYANNRISFETGEPMLKYYEHEEKAETSPFYCHIDKSVSGSAEQGKTVLNGILGNQHNFDTVKPLGVIKYLIKHSTSNDAMILDSFAGSGTTAQSILELNQDLSSHRRFIMIEIMDYAETITAERTKRVIQGYSTDKGNVPGISGDFSYYELGDTIMNDGVLNPAISIEKIREYIYFTETKQPLPEKSEKEPYLLGVYYDCAYYFCYEKVCLTTLNRSLFRSFITTAKQYVIYADSCTLNETLLENYHITFKKIPRDITKL